MGISLDCKLSQGVVGTFYAKANRRVVGSYDFMPQAFTLALGQAMVGYSFYLLIQV